MSIEPRKITAQDLAMEIEAHYYEAFSGAEQFRKLRFVLYFVFAVGLYFAWMKTSTWVGIPTNLAQVLGVGFVVLFVFALCEYFYTPMQERKDEIRDYIRELLSTTIITKSETELLLERFERNKKQRVGGYWYPDVMCLRWVTLSKLPWN